MKINIKIIIENEDTGEVIAKRETGNWEIAEMNLESLKQRHLKEGYKEYERPLKTYSIILKGNCSFPDYEDMVEAESMEEAVKHFSRQSVLREVEESVIRENIREDNQLTKIQ